MSTVYHGFICSFINSICPYSVLYSCMAHTEFCKARTGRRVGTQGALTNLILALCVCACVCACACINVWVCEPEMRINTTYSLCSIIKKSIKKTLNLKATTIWISVRDVKSSQVTVAKNKMPRYFHYFIHPALALSQGEIKMPTLMFHRVLTTVLNWSINWCWLL